MLNKPVDKVHFDAANKFTGVESAGETAKAPIVVGDPSYFSDKVKKIGSVVRCICLMDHPIPNISDRAKSCQIIIPQSELRRKNDMYIICLSYVHKVCPDGWYIALVSTTVETENPEAEIEPGLKLLGPVRERFVSVSDLYEPLTDGVQDRCFISKSLDATTHFESCCDDILSLYKRITGKDYDWESEPDQTAQS